MSVSRPATPAILLTSLAWCAGLAAFSGPLRAGVPPAPPVRLEAALLERFAAESHSARLGAPVVDALTRQERTRVLIALDPALADDGRLAARSAALLRTLPASGFEVRRQFERVPGVALEISAPALAALLDDPAVLRVDLDAGGKAALAQAVPLVHADIVQASGITGAGATVAILDTGIDATHVDLTGALDGEACFCSTADNVGCCPGGGETRTGPGSAVDDNGHGTHVAGIVTGNGGVAPRGVAPGSRVVAVKVLDATGSFCCSSDVVAALDWIAANRPDVDAVNLSLGTNALFPGDCDSATAYTLLFSAAVAQLRAQGIAVVAASGNDGSGTSMSAPACVHDVLSVGATWDANVGYQGTMCLPPPDGPGPDTTTSAGKIACFSNTDASLDLVAPGAPIDSTLRGGGVVTYYGTSMAAPMAAGCAALLREAYPGTPAAGIEGALRSSPTLATDSTNGLTFPLLDCQRALAVVQLSNTTPCVRDSHTACLLAGRFEVKVTWRTASATGDATVMSFGGQRTESDQSVFYYFFNAENFEMGVKMVDACSAFGKHWVFASGLTNQAYTITVRDTQTGTIKTYSNPLGTYPQTVGDTAALPCP